MDNNSHTHLEPTIRPCRAEPPPYQSISHTHRVQHFDSEQWQGLEPTASFVWESPYFGKAHAVTGKPHWEVRLRVKSRDLRRLMREGFHWDMSNFDFEATYTQTHLGGEKPSLFKRGWTCRRNFFLSDLRDKPYWTAKLTVFAREISVLKDFDVTDITPHNMSWACAFVDATQASACGIPRTIGENQQVYSWVLDSPSDTWNNIYGDLVLDGWWPWPKADVHTT
ncbi:hypothetical protein CGCA056_v012644 [Colletotrichum aenigma]|uniref:uncharacterized protein n=1 Tax=Colletotrichum aenigma TaxID=1215731 RepID=UPI00187308C0|nr:uncharacterized protein CGCA056_v012644 [Colletotrichum aenigma]KAF5512264.1 hypothetical protein CGCA056_v012644 [Colletotrichum aenigma]